MKFIKNMFNNEVSYTVDEFLNEEKRKEVELEFRNEKIKQMVIPVATATGLAITAVVLIGNKEIVVPVMLSKATKKVIAETVVASASTSSGLEVFNELVVQALNKMYGVICLGGLTVSSIQTNSWNDKSKFSSCIMKYSITYAGGLFILYTLAQIKDLK